jgi:hypothetical protein
MRLRANRRTERAAVNAARTFFEDNECVFQEIDGANDYGKDAYVDIGDEGLVTGTCAALQIKGGRSFRTPNGDYRLPVDDDHRRAWRESTVPVIGIVHDPDDGQLRWVDISASLRVRPDAKSIRVDRQHILSRESLRSGVVESIRRSAAGAPAGLLTQVLDADEDTSIGAIFDALATGRRDPRVLVGLRYLLRALSERPRRAAIHVLSHATPHPDIVWHEGNWLPDQVKHDLQSHFRWSVDDISTILNAAPLGTFERGEIGESAYMLLRQDPGVEETMASAAGLALRRGDYCTAEAALYLVLYWLGMKAPDALRAFLREYPEAAELPLLPEMQAALLEHGYLTLF